MPPKRKNIRLKDYDYSQKGFYFITICTQHHLCLFGYIENNEIILNDAGNMISKWWQELNRKYPDIQLHHCITMPNHFHGIVQITDRNSLISPDKNPIPNVGADLRVCPIDKGGHTGPPVQRKGGHTGPPLHAMIQWFKTMTTNEYMQHVKKDGWSLFPGKLWQRNYYEHIIRNEKSFHEISDYIANNPINWEKDKYYLPQ